MSVAYIRPKSRTERPRKTKIGTEVAHVTRDSDTTFKVKRSKVKVTGGGILWRHPAQLVITVSVTLLDRKVTLRGRLAFRVKSSTFPNMTPAPGLVQCTAGDGLSGIG